MHSFKDGYREGVIFALVKEGKLLIEIRPNNEYFIPNGSIEEKDKNQNKDYRIITLEREAKEELNINLIDFKHIMDYKVENPKLWFYIYLITDWKGKIPDYYCEPPGSNKKFADLKWINIKDYKNYFTLPSAIVTCEKIIEILKL